MRALRELRKVYPKALPSGFAVPYGGRPGQQGCLTTRKTLLDSNYELPASRGLTDLLPVFGLFGVAAVRIVTY